MLFMSQMRFSIHNVYLTTEKLYIETRQDAGHDSVFSCAVALLTTGPTALTMPRGLLQVAWIKFWAVRSKK